ncbi:hypothetical protein V5O48_002084 [Marasmius crinis-equi]|uniref:Uncharacterized protein n=1 Tax=Marasmius crinis-equi TaxID=585013 RepID=A0ABR3FX70_9AGAR
MFGFPSRWIRVHFYTHINKVRLGCTPDLIGEAMLSQNGGLDVRQVMDKWGLEDCCAIDPTRWEPFNRTRENHLSALAVRLLSERSGCLIFTEPEVSKSTARKRAFREGAVSLFESITTLLTLIAMTILNIIFTPFRNYTPIVEWSQEVRRAWHLEEPTRARLMKEYGKTLKCAGCAIMAILLLASLLLTYSMMGLVEFEAAPRQRAYNWARSGSFVLGKI